MKKGDMFPTTTEVLDHFEASVNGKYYGDVSLFYTYIEGVGYGMYIVEYSMRSTGMGIDHRIYDREASARVEFDDRVAEIKKDVIKALQSEVA